MANVYCTSNVSFSVNEEEKEVLQKAHDILDVIEDDWNIRDSNAWDNDNYWELDNTVKLLERLFGCKDNKDYKTW